MNQIGFNKVRKISIIMIKTDLNESILIILNLVF